MIRKSQTLICDQGLPVWKLSSKASERLAAEKRRYHALVNAQALQWKEHLHAQYLSFLDACTRELAQRGVLEQQAFQQEKAWREISDCVLDFSLLLHQHALIFFYFHLLHLSSLFFFLCFFFSVSRQTALCVGEQYQEAAASRERERIQLDVSARVLQDKEQQAQQCALRHAQDIPRARAQADAAVAAATASSLALPPSTSSVSAFHASVIAAQGGGPVRDHDPRGEADGAYSESKASDSTPLTGTALPVASANTRLPVRSSPLPTFGSASYFSPPPSSSSSCSSSVSGSFSSLAQCCPLLDTPFASFILNTLHPK